MNTLTSQAMNNEIEEINNMGSVEDGLQYLKKLKVLEQALRSVDAFYDQSVKFARLHVAALLKVVELGGISSLKGLTRKVAEWLSELDEKERNIFVSMCSDGATIIYIWKKYVNEPQKDKDSFELLEEIKKQAISEVVEKGIIDIKPYQEEIRKIAPKSIATDIDNGMRIRMRDAGAVGVGYDSGIYVMPMQTEEQKYSEQANYISKACYTRFKSICRDIAKLREIIQKSQIRFSYQDCISTNDLGHYRYTIDELRVLFMFADAGLFKDAEELEMWMNDSARWKSNRRNDAPKTGREYYMWEAKDPTLYYG